jgi:hypothetical protein
VQIHETQIADAMLAGYARDGEADVAPAECRLPNQPRRGALRNSAIDHRRSTGH